MATDPAPAPRPEEPEGPGGMTFLEHLDELRLRVVWSGTAIFLGFLGCYPWRREEMAFLSRPLALLLPPGEALAYTRLSEPFFVQLKVAALAGILIASPIVFLQIWLFIAPGLYASEKRYLLPFLTTATGFFLLGAWFAFSFLLPSICRFFLEQATGLKMVVTIDEYFSLLFWTVIGVAVTFELPIVMGLLARLGVISGDLLIRRLDVAVVGILVVAAIVTPTPDAMTMLFVAAPMMVLYLVGIVVAKLLAPPKDSAPRTWYSGGGTGPA